MSSSLSWVKASNGEVPHRAVPAGKADNGTYCVDTCLCKIREVISEQYGISGHRSSFRSLAAVLVVNVLYAGGVFSLIHSGLI